MLCGLTAAVVTPIPPNYFRGDGVGTIIHITVYNRHLRRGTVCGKVQPVNNLRFSGKSGESAFRGVVRHCAATVATSLWGLGVRVLKRLHFCEAPPRARICIGLSFYDIQACASRTHIHPAQAGFFDTGGL